MQGGAFPLGVDIGTTFTAAALWRAGRVETVPLGNRSNLVPSLLFLRDDGTFLVGEAAVRRGIADPTREAREFKRRMGDDIPVRLGEQGFPAHELMGHLLRWVVDTAAEREGGRPSHVVLTCPAEWEDYRRGLLAQVAAAAGLGDVGLLPEPVAAATWYCAQERVEPGALIGIYDFGGGTFDASVVRKTETGVEIHGTPGGDDALGGVDLDHVLFRHVATAAGLDPAVLNPDDSATASALAQLFAAIVDAKETLSGDVEAIVPVLLPGLKRDVVITRTEFESLVRPQLLSTVEIFGQVVSRAGADPEQLRAVLLVGGSSRIPLVTQLLRAELGIRVAVDAHPKYLVSLGAAIAAAPRVAPVVAHPGWPPPPVVEIAAPARDPQPVVPPPSPAEPVAPAPVKLPVDLAETGLTAPTDVKITVPQAPGIERPPVTDRDEPVVVRTRGAGEADYFRRGRRAAVIVFVAVALGLAAIVAVALHGAADGTGGAAPSLEVNPPAEPGVPAPPSVGTAALTGQVVGDPAGVDTMRALTTLPSGDLVSVGVSLDQRPRAWVRRGETWQPVPLPDTGHGLMAGVAAARSGGKTRLVAVGWVGGGERHQAAVWVSADGTGWRLLDLSPDLGADGMRELTAVVATAAGDFLAVGEDRRADPADGDTAVFRSADGEVWQRVAASGLDGLGPQEVRRIIQTRSGKFVAIGSTLQGALRVPTVWTSDDGAHWQPTGTAPSSPTGTPALWALQEQPDGSLLTCGSVGPVDELAVGCWIQRDDTSWEPLDVVPDHGSAIPVHLYDLTTAPDGIMVVGTARVPSAVHAAAWTLRVQPR